MKKLKYALLLCCAFTVASFEFSSSHQREPFWIAVDVHRVEYRRACFSLCKDPRLELAFANTETAQTTSKAWTMEGTTNGNEGDFQRMTSWTAGGPANVSLRGAVFCTDVQLKFQRMCDVDPDRSSFQFFVENVIMSDLDRGSYEFTASCLNVTLQAQLFTERCPWCPGEVRQEAILVGMLWAHQEAQVSDVNFAKLQHYGLVVLGALCAALLAAVTALLCAQSRRKRNFRANNARVSSAELPDIVRSDGVRPHTGPDRERLLRLPLTPPNYCEISDEPVAPFNRQSFHSVDLSSCHTSPNSSLNSSLSIEDSGRCSPYRCTYDSP